MSRADAILTHKGKGARIAEVKGYGSSTRPRESEKSPRESEKDPQTREATVSTTMATSLWRRKPDHIGHGASCPNANLSRVIQGNAKDWKGHHDVRMCSN